ncbi:Hydrogenase isoenzymes nickel incorporation protein HypB [Acaryochloris thomasi RCC1774]|uniref:Hydrogenase isoenzymes nickel incorporation protein HypB n=1 Tax=Acaryochloris thomasi RCC1774 TaxID=1764569 RepID=A0A2W1JLR4_9CYAN|nr:hydrogenase nickel incorporation protein HypB [Acaryochloris thomasi]PZD71114.1 Hydrogenase isoenzymes nickel incorporation protein HypB [Acaryochloris thomasi RCC1774]
MCQDCGCSEVGPIQIGYEHHVHIPEQPSQLQTESKPDLMEPLPRRLEIQTNLLSQNDRIAAQNRSFFDAQCWQVINILSAPGSGKTALIERLVKDCRDRWQIGVIVGDLATDNDAQRLEKAGTTAVHITTGNACHLEAGMIAKAVERLPKAQWDLLIIENVGNLVCPAAFDLGEHLRVVLLSVTEGEDKPLKYPTMFKSAQVVIVNKADIADAVGWDRESAIANIQKIAPQATIFEVSARTGEGMEHWYAYLDNGIQQAQISQLSQTSNLRLEYGKNILKR